jgi:ornithine cyclodeaminase/alanine dehydrogenase-like protein (mu-crystallin family)
MEPANTILLQRKDVARLLSIEECMDAVEQAFCLHAEGKALPPKVLGIQSTFGGFHIKTGIMDLSRSYFVAKINANFPGNPKQNGLPTIQGVIIVCDANDGRLLALMDSIEITILRTGAATGVAAKYLSCRYNNIVTICGCGNQGRISLKALMKVRELKRVYAFDLDETQSAKLKKEFELEVEIVIVNFDELPRSLKQSQIVITCTTSKQPFIRLEDIGPGTFIAAVGADSEDKQELCAGLTASAKLVADIAEQSATIGEMHHAIKHGLATVSDVYAELGVIVSGKKTGRESEKEIIIFDSTGTALQDVAAAAIVYEKAIEKGMGTILNFSDTGGNSQNFHTDLKALRSWFPFR